jgi:PAS domain S-box-containing protein
MNNIDTITLKEREKPSAYFNIPNATLSTKENAAWLLDNNGITTHVNTKMASILGRPEEEVVGKSFFDFLNERGKAAANEAGMLLDYNRGKQLELEFTHGDGTTVYALVEASNLKDEKGGLAGAILSITDISDRKRFEGASLESQKKYSELFQHMADGFAYCQLLFGQHEKPVDYVFLDVNEAFRRLTGLKDKPVLGRRASQVFPKKDSCDWTGIYGKVAFEGKSTAFEKYVPSFDQWLSIHMYCPESGFVATIIEDITQRKKIEQELRQSEKQYKKLANSITDLFFALDSSLRFTYWNKASEKYTGINAENTVGKHIFQVLGRDKATRRVVKIYHSVMKNRRSQTFTNMLPMKATDAIFETHVYPTGNGISVFAKDITERKKLQEKLEQYAKHLEELVRIRTEKLKGVERLAAIGETAGMIGHDIRNPLQSIIGELFLAKEELNQLPENENKKNLTESILSIEEQTIYINKIVTDLQDYAKPLTPALQEIDFEENIKAAISTLTVPDNIKVNIYVNKPFPIIKTDPSFIKRILTNLSLNGIQAMQEKGGELTINAFPREKTVILAITDTGTGIPDEAKEKIFKPLFTTKSKGQGFGLAVVKKLVEALDGNINFETTLGKGTTFIVEMPIKND